jgi:hypothetical protein
MITIDWATKTINVPKDYLEDNDVVPGTYKLDVNRFKNDIGAILDDADGIVNDDIFINNSPFELDGVVYARGLKIINGYSVTFEDGHYAVYVTGANSNIASVANINMVSIRPMNSAGLQIVDKTAELPDECGLTQEEHDKLMALDTTNLDVKVSTRVAKDDIPDFDEIDFGLTDEEHEKLMNVPDENKITDAVWNKKLGVPSKNG